MDGERIQRIVVVGGGTAGWMTAALLAKALGRAVRITLVESEDIGTVGVGEATIPQIRLINDFLGLDEDTVMRATKATFKLGIQFNDWLRPGHAYLHAFSDIGLPQAAVPFQHWWLRARAQGDASGLWAYSLNAQAAAAGRMARLGQVGGSPLTGMRWAYHFDAGLYAQYLRTVAVGLGVHREEGIIVDVDLQGEDGFIAALKLQNGVRVTGDLFIDCSGFRALLIEGALHAGFDDWRRWLPCDRALAVPSARVGEALPYTQASARAAGWQWRIPLQHRTGNGHVYCSEFMGDDEALAVLRANLDGDPLGEPRPFRFTTGMRREVWVKNCVALGLAAGFMEPLESTSIHLVQSGVDRLLKLFPDARFEPSVRAAFNRQTRFEYERIRDFLVLHYTTTERRDTPFWRHCAAIERPGGLQDKMDLFRACGQIFRDGEELFTEVGWLQVLVGQGVQPQTWHPLADALDSGRLDEFMVSLRTIIQRAVAAMPTHGRFIAEHCAA